MIPGRFIFPIKPDAPAFSSLLIALLNAGNQFSCLYKEFCALLPKFCTDSIIHSLYFSYQTLFFILPVVRFT